MARWPPRPTSSRATSDTLASRNCSRAEANGGSLFLHRRVTAYVNTGASSGAGYVRNTSGAAGEAEFDGGLATPGLSPAGVTWQGDLTSGRASVNLTGFRPDFTPANGMLFVSANSSDNNTNIAAALPSGNGWTVAVREDNDTDTTGNTYSALSDSQFQFMHVDFRSRNLVGAKITGATGATIRGAGAYTLTRLSAGRHALAIPGKVDTSGMLLLGVAGQQAGPGGPVSRAFLSYQFDAANGRFVIEARELTGGSTAALVDSDFNFTFVDFANPVQPKFGPTVASVTPNPGSPQRSRVTNIAVTFDAVVTCAGPVANAFQLSRIGGGAVGGFTATAQTVGGVTVVTLTDFIGAETVGNSPTPGQSLVDGRYAVTVLASQVSVGEQQFDGSGDGGDNFTLNGTALNGLFRFYGDFDGDGDVDGSDPVLFLPTIFNGANYAPQFDFDNDGDVDGTDLVEFVQNLFIPLP